MNEKNIMCITKLFNIINYGEKRQNPYDLNLDFLQDMMNTQYTHTFHLVFS